MPAAQSFSLGTDFSQACIIFTLCLCTSSPFCSLLWFKIYPSRGHSAFYFDARTAILHCGLGQVLRGKLPFLRHLQFITVASLLQPRWRVTTRLTRRRRRRNSWGKETSSKGIATSWVKSLTLAQGSSADLLCAPSLLAAFVRIHLFS